MGRKKQYPFNVIEAFFDIFGMEGFRHSFDHWIEASMSPVYCWKEGSPGNLLFLHDELQKLIVVADFLNHAVKDKNLKTDSSSFAGLVKINKHVSHNENLPQHLNIFEINCPMLVVRSFFEFQPFELWHEELRLWLEMGLSNQTIFEEPDQELRIFPVTNHIKKLVEAMHIINLMGRASIK